MMHLWDMLLAGGTKALVMGLAGVLCTVWGVYQLRNPPRKGVRVLHLICCTTPALVGLWVFCKMFSSYLVIADSSVAPTREEFDLVMSHAVIFGTLSILCTLIPLGLAVSALMNHRSRTGLAT